MESAQRTCSRLRTRWYPRSWQCRWSWSPSRADKILWIPMVYGPLLIAVRVGFRPLLDRAGNAVLVVLRALLAVAAYLQPVKQEIGFGQVDLLLLALCAVDCLVDSPRWPRGLLIGLATAIKLEPGVFIIYFLLTGRRREAGTAALSFAALTALAWLISPRDSMAYWTSVIFKTRKTWRQRVGRRSGPSRHDAAASRCSSPRSDLDSARGHRGRRRFRGSACLLAARERACGHCHNGSARRSAIPGRLDPPLLLGTRGHWRDRRRRAASPPSSTGCTRRGALSDDAADLGRATQPAAQRDSFAGFMLENSFGLAALALIPLLFWVGLSHGGEQRHRLAGRIPGQAVGAMAVDAGRSLRRSSARSGGQRPPSCGAFISGSSA